MDFDKILDDLYVGSFPESNSDIDALKRNGITAVLNLQSDEDLRTYDVDWSALHTHYVAVGIKVRRAPMRDFDDDDLRSQLPDAALALAELLDDDHKVFVHCNAGVNRSPSVIISYLHWFQNWTLDDAEGHVRNCHPCAPVMQVIKQASTERQR